MELNKLRLLSGIPIKASNKTVVVIEKKVTLEEAKKIVELAKEVVNEKQLFKSNGEHFIGHTFSSVDDANAHMKKNTDDALLHADDENSKYYVASKKSVNPKDHADLKVHDKEFNKSVNESTGSYAPDTNAVTWQDGKKPVNVMSKDDTLYNPIDTVKHEKETTPYPPSDMKMSGMDEETIKVPADIKSSLRSKIKELFDSEERYRTIDPQSASFMLTAGHALEDLLNHLEDGDVTGIKRAQVFMSSLMGPIIELIPNNAYDFIVRGGIPRTISNIFKEIKVDIKNKI